MFLFRAFAVWLLIMFAESVHGTLRQLFLAPLVGDFLARRIAFFVGIVLIFLTTYFCIRWINARSVKLLLTVGVMWMVLTALFEFALGIFILRYSWKRIFEDYDVSRGGLMAFGLLFLCFAPLRRKQWRGMKIKSVEKFVSLCLK